MKSVSINKILVPVDFTKISGNACEAAAALVVMFGAKLILFHVLETNNDPYFIIPEAMGTVHTLPRIERTVKSKMNALQEELNYNYGLKTESSTAKGQIDSEIIRFSKKKKIDLIVMGTHGLSGYKEMFIGSNAQRVVTVSDVPVLTIQKKIKKSGFKNILIPIDNSQHSREKVNLAMLIGNKSGAKIHLIGLPESKEKSDLNKFKIKLKSVEDIIRGDKLNYATAIVHGKTLAKAAMNYGAKNKCDLVVINTGHESKVTGVFPGPFAQQIINHSKIPVLSVKHSEDHYTIQTPGFAV